VAAGAWANGFTACTDVVIGVIDEGIQVGCAESHAAAAAHYTLAAVYAHII
jgi:hypothetical protein